VKDRGQRLGVRDQKSPEPGAVNLQTICPIRDAEIASRMGAPDGKPITVHHLVATIAGARSDNFSGAETQHLQANASAAGIRAARKGFVLTPPARPQTPPAK